VRPGLGLTVLGEGGWDHRSTLVVAVLDTSSLRNRSHPPSDVKLDQFLKFQGLVATGGEAKQRIQRGDVRVNGLTETRRGRQLAIGDAVSLDGQELLVTPRPRG
jgi:ribosome-associated protein